MFGRFWHRDLQRGQQLLELTVAVLRKHNQNDLDTVPALLKALDTAIESFAAANDLPKASQLESLKAELITSERGINPYTFEKVHIGRNALNKIVAFKILQSLEAILRQHLNEITLQLKEGGNLLQHLVLLAVQNASLSAEQIEQADSPEAVESIWEDLGKDATLGVAQKKILLTVGFHDAILLLDQILIILRGRAGV